MLADRVRMGVQSEGGYTIIFITFHMGNAFRENYNYFEYNINEEGFVSFIEKPHPLILNNIKTLSVRSRAKDAYGVGGFRLYDHNTQYITHYYHPPGSTTWKTSVLTPHLPNLSMVAIEDMMD
jgi:hypothetical protein